MSVAAIRLRAGGWFNPGARKGNKWQRQQRLPASPKRAAKPAKNLAAAKHKVRVGASLVASMLFVLRVFGWLMGLVSVLALLIGISLGLVVGYRALTNSSHFAVSHVEITGNRQLSTAEVLNLSGVTVGMSILEVSLGEMSRRMKHNPWIETVMVRRILPDGVAIEITEREPFFWIQQGGALYYADRNGTPIAALELGRFVSLPVLIVEEGAEPNWALLGDVVRAMERLEFPFGFPEVGWLKVEDANILRIYLEDQGMVVHFDMSNWREHRRIMSQVWEDLRSRGELHNIVRLTIMAGKAWAQSKHPLGS